MKLSSLRFKSAAKAMGWHFGASALVAIAVAILVFAVWFPYPYRQLSGGTELFILVMAVDLVCGPLLTFVLFNPAKLKRELVLDLSLVVALQLAALAYGIWSVHAARPLFLVHEFDRFKVIALADIDEPELTKLPKALQPQLFKGPQMTGLREITNEERKKVMFEALEGGRDYGERPSFYATYDATRGANAYLKAKPIVDFAHKHTAQKAEIDKLQIAAGTTGQKLRYIPIIARQDWVAVVTPQGEIVGYLRGDGF